VATVFFVLKGKAAAKVGITAAATSKSYMCDNRRFRSNRVGDNAGNRKP
jgi:hypothetical protein